MQETLVQEDPWRRDRATHSSINGLPWLLSWGKLPRGEHGKLTQCSSLDNLHGGKSLARYSPWATKSWTQLSDQAQHNEVLQHHENNVQTGQ